MRFVIGTLLCLACLIAEPVQAAEIDYGRYHAMVIGNNQYEHLPQLETAVSDAAAVAEILRLKYGFEVELLIKATRGEILSAVNTLRAQLTQKDRLLVAVWGRLTEMGRNVSLRERGHRRRQLRDRAAQSSPRPQRFDLHWDKG